MNATMILLSAVPPGDEPPSEVCLFKKGDNETDKGVFLFDEQSAALVMKAYEQRGTRCYFDWNHASLDLHPVDPKESCKAAGWFDLEVRAGELWAINIAWAPAALDAFYAKEISYISPAFLTDDENRITDFINCALTNLPATHDLDQLIAAARGAASKDSDMHCLTREEVKICYLLGTDPVKALADKQAATAEPPPAAPPAPDAVTQRKIRQSLGLEWA
jgi:phage I-like protein